MGVPSEVSIIDTRRSLPPVASRFPSEIANAGDIEIGNSTRNISNSLRSGNEDSSQKDASGLCVHVLRRRRIAGMNTNPYESPETDPGEMESEAVRRLGGLEVLGTDDERDVPLVSTAHTAIGSQRQLSFR